MDISTRIKKAIKSSPYTMKDVAAKMHNTKLGTTGLSQQTLSALLDRAIPFSRIEEMADILGCTPGDLIGEENVGPCRASGVVPPGSPSGTDALKAPSVGESIRKAMRERGWTMTRLAEEMTDKNGQKGVTQGAVSSIINGNPTLAKLTEIANIIGCSVSDLIGEGKQQAPIPRPEPQPVQNVSGSSADLSNPSGNIKRILDDKGISLQEFAVILGIDLPGLQQILDKPTMRQYTLDKMARKLGLTSEQVLAYPADGEGSLTALIDYNGHLYKAKSIEELQTLVDHFRAGGA